MLCPIIPTLLLNEAALKSMAISHQFEWGRAYFILSHKVFPWESALLYVCIVLNIMSIQFQLRL